MLDDDFLVERLLVDIKQVVRDTIREEIALLGLSMEADAEHGLPVTPRPATEPRILFTGLGTHIKPSKAAKPGKVLIESNPLVVDLRDLRSQTAKNLGRLPYQIFSNSSLNGIVVKMPRNKAELLDVWGFGQRKVDLYGTDIIRIVNRYQPSSSQKQERVETFSIPDTVPDNDDSCEEENGVFSTDGTFMTYEELDAARKEEAAKQEAERFANLYEYIIAMDPDTRFDAEELREEYALNWERTPWERLMKEGFVERRHHQGQSRGGLYRTSMLRSE